MSKVDDPVSIARRGRSLGAVSRELSRVNRTLRRLAAGPARREISGASVRAMVAARRLRESCFDPAISDLAWAILLEAYAARLDGRLSPMTSLGAPAGIARSTGHRWVAALLERGLLTRHADPHDDRIALIGLSEDAAVRIRDYLAAALKQAPLLP
jgi:DNA-binding MarR family transcriptional regulator